MKYILGKKIEMTRLWQGENVVPVTKVAVGPCTVVQIKTKANDGYDAVQLAYGERKEKNIAKPQLKHTEGLGNFRWMREFRYNFAGRPEDKTEFDMISRGDIIDASTFAVGDLVNVVGHSKGRGFQGGVKRHGFHGHNTTHGTKDQVRMPGSIGAGEPQHVFKGTRMAGRMGNEQVTVQNLEVIKVNPEENTILIKGGLPGARNSLLLISGEGALTVKKESSNMETADTTAEATNEIVAKPEEEMQKEAETKPVPEAEAVKADAEIKEQPKTEAAAAEAKPETIETNVEVKTDATPVKKDEPETTEPVVAAKPVEVKQEEKPAEAKQESVDAKPAEPVVEKDVYLKMFENIPATERERYSSPEALEAISALEEKYKIDLLPILTKLAVKDVAPADLASHIVLILKMDQDKAEEIAAAIKEKNLC